MSFISFAQNYEDVMLWRALHDVENGFYVDVGAGDPEELSVTRAFYDRGWSGINVEPLQEYFAKLTQARSRDTNLQVAAGREAGLRVMHTVAGTGLSTLDQEIAAGHQGTDWQVHDTGVPVLTLATILEQFGAPVIHFLKIDVEGAEGEVLEGLNLDRVRPWIIVIEATEPNSTVSTREKWEHLVVRHGYGFAYFDGLNCFYVADEVSSLKERLAVPPNVFDEFVRWQDWSTAQKAAKLEEDVAGLRGHAIGLEEALQAERIQSITVRNALSAEQAESARLRNALQVEQGQVATLSNTLQAELSRMDASLQQLAGRLAVPSADRALGRVLDRFWSMGNRLTGGGVRAFATRMLAESLRRHPRLGGLASGELKPFPKPGTHVRQPSSPPKVVIPPNEGAEVTIDLAPDQSRLVEISFFGQQGRNVVRFETDGDRVKVESDPRDLFFNVRIVSSETRELIGRVKLLDGFSGLEIDGGLYHVWAIARRADLQIEEIPGEHKTAPYVFELSASSERSIKISRPAPDSVKFAPWDESVAASVIPASAQPVYRSLLAAMSDSNAWNQHR